MRRGWHENWDTTEKAVWTVVAYVWAILLGFALIVTTLGFIPGTRQLTSDLSPLQAIGWAIVAHLFVYVLMWLRRMLWKPKADTPTGKERDA